MKYKESLRGITSTIIVFNKSYADVTFIQDYAAVTYDTNISIIFWI